MPLGQYDPDKLVNIGTNRFTFKPELGISKTFGHLLLELETGAAFYTVNHDFYQGKTQSQSPIGSVQGHIIYSFKRGIWTALDGTYYWGGHTTLDGVEGNDLQKNSRLGFTLALPYFSCQVNHFSHNIFYVNLLHPRKFIATLVM